MINASPARKASFGSDICLDYDDRERARE